MVTQNKDAVAEVPLALVSNPYLDELTAGLRARPIPWEVQQSFLLTPRNERSAIPLTHLLLALSILVLEPPNLAQDSSTVLRKR